jgi:hypothetical protein
MIILFMMTKKKYITFFEKQNMLVICEVKYGFLDIFIWFDRVRRALQEYEYQKKFDAVSNTKLEGNQED